jgi:hypothetical protein
MTKIANAISISLDAMAQTMIGTSRMRPNVMMFGMLTRRFPAQKTRLVGWLNRLLST